MINSKNSIQFFILQYEEKLKTKIHFSIVHKNINITIILLLNFNTLT